MIACVRSAIDAVAASDWLAKHLTVASTHARSPPLVVGMRTRRARSIFPFETTLHFAFDPEQHACPQSAPAVQPVRIGGLERRRCPSFRV
jgi:hypothetical protein